MRAAAILSAALLCALIGGDARATEATAGGRAFRFLDRPLVEARGERYRFVADLIARSPVLLSFTLTGCKVTCLPSDAVMDHVAERLGGAGGVRLVTITLNPLEDTPQRLTETFVKDHHPARLYLSGEALDVFAVLDGLGVSGASDENHSVQFIAIGRGGKTVVPVEGPDPEAVLAAIETIR